MQKIDSTEINRITKWRAVQEANLARDLRDFFFLGREILEEMRGFVAQAIEQILVMAERDAAMVGVISKEQERRRIDNLKKQWEDATGFQKTKLFHEIEVAKVKVSSTREQDRVREERSEIDQLIAGEDRLQVWRLVPPKFPMKPTVVDLKKIYYQRQQWTPLDCSDLIRLYATITESKKKNLRKSGFVGTDVAGLQDGARIGGKPYWEEGRKRWDKSQGSPPEGDKAEEAHVADGREEAIRRAKRDGEKSAGLARYKLWPQSTIRKIDAVFGLPAGADISGTTADSIFFMSSVEDFFRNLDRQTRRALGITTLGEDLPIIQLLPLATMVSRGHHTVLESAIVLSMTSSKDEDKDWSQIYKTSVDYKIGFYSSLMPTNADLMRDTKVCKVKHLLERYEFQGRENHILCFTNRNPSTNMISWEGYRMEPKDIENFKTLARADRNLLIFFLGKEPSKQNVQELINLRIKGSPWLLD